MTQPSTYTSLSTKEIYNINRKVNEFGLQFYKPPRKYISPDKNPDIPEPKVTII
jgi:hypothetical protein